MMRQHIVVRLIGGTKLLSSGQVTKERKKKDLMEGVPGGGRAQLLTERPPVRPYFLDSDTSDKLGTMPLT